MSRTGDRHADTLVHVAGRLVEFLRTGRGFDELPLGDTVTLYLAPEGGGARASIARHRLRDPVAWAVVTAGGKRYAFAPRVGMTERTLRVGRHFNCMEYSLDTRFKELAERPHVAVRLSPRDPSSCLETWNLTMVFDSSASPRVIAVVYDQWEW